MRGIMAGSGGNAVMRVPARFLPEMRGRLLVDCGSITGRGVVEADGQAGRASPASLRTASRTPGMKLVRSSCRRMVSCSPALPKNFLVGVEAAQTPQRVHVDAVDHLAA